MNRLENECYRSPLYNLGDNCSILDKIACNPITTTPHLTHTHTHPYSLISSHSLSSYNPLVKPFLSMRTPQPEGPCQGKLGRGGGFCFAALSEKERKIQIISCAGAI